MNPDRSFSLATVVFCNLPLILFSVEKCIHCGQLILQKISYFFATKYQILRLKCTKFDFRWGFAPDPAGGAYSVPPDPLAVFNGAYFQGEEEGKWRGREGKERGGDLPDQCQCAPV